MHPLETHALYTLFNAVTGGFAEKSFSAPAMIFCADPENPELNGQTSFARHHHIHQLGLRAVQQISKSDTAINILAAPASIGCEAHALSAEVPEIIGSARPVWIDTFDISSTFSRLAMAGAYPVPLVLSLSAASERTRDKIFGPNMPAAYPMVPVKKLVRDRVHVLPPMPFENFRADKPYDLVLINNLFRYADAKKCDDALTSILDGEPALFITTADKADKAVSGKLASAGYLNSIDAFHADPVWRRTCLAAKHDVFSSVPKLMERYQIWARPH